VTSIREHLDSNVDDRVELERLRAEVAAWRKAYEQGRLREIGFNNSAREVEPLYTPLDVAEADPARLGVPGAYPYTRGIHPTG
jgi:methylmalonyl-CoA mutase, N-terminal domain